jgi:hypothetical protein
VLCCGDGCDQVLDLTDQAQALSKFLKTSNKKVIPLYYLPATHTNATEALLRLQQSAVNEQLKRPEVLLTAETDEEKLAREKEEAESFARLRAKAGIVTPAASTSSSSSSSSSSAAAADSSASKSAEDSSSSSSASSSASSSSATASTASAAAKPDSEDAGDESASAGASYSKAAADKDDAEADANAEDEAL